MKSRLGIVLLLMSMLFLFALLGARYVLGGWISFLWIPLGGFIVTFCFALFFSYKKLVSFLKFRSTRFGLSMGRLLLLFLMGLSVVNYLAFNMTFSWDLSRDQINSLSAQTENVLKSLKENVQITVFHRGSSDYSKLGNVRNLLELYLLKSNLIKYRFVNYYENPKLANQFITKKEFEEKSLNAYLSVNGRKIKIDHPFNEEKLTQAFIKLGRSVVKKVYVSEGHGEKNIGGGENDPKSISKLVQGLSDYSFEVVPIHLEKVEFIPFEANVLAVVGPEVPFTIKALEKIENFLDKGGKLLLLLDPGESAKVWLPFLEKKGVEYKNNFILDPSSSLGQTIVITEVYNPEHMITERFENRSTAFSYASAMEVQDNVSWRATALVSSSQGTFTVNSLTSDWSASDRGNKILGLTLENEETKGAVVLFADSDFAADQLIYAFSNRDLILNSIAFLTKEDELISIKPNSLSSQQLNLSRSQTLSLTVLFTVIPLLLFGISIYLWVNKRRKV